MAELKACNDLALSAKQMIQVAETQSHNAVHCDDKYPEGRRMLGWWMTGAAEAARRAHAEAASALEHVVELAGRMTAFEETHLKKRREPGLPTGIEFECWCGHRAQDHAAFGGIDSMGVPRMSPERTATAEEPKGCQAEVPATETEAAHICHCNHYRHRTSYVRKEN